MNGSVAVALQPAQRTAAVAVLNRAFQDDVAYSYVLPDQAERSLAMERLWKALIGYCSFYGEVFTTPEVSGVACWLPPKGSPALWQMLRTGFALPRAIMSLRKPARDRMAALMQHNDDMHRRVIAEAHWYLAALGVDPSCQRRGVGSALLQPVLARADAEGTSCYLETQTEGNVRFYESQGFAVAEDAVVPGHGVRMWAMIRRARSQ